MTLCFLTMHAENFFKLVPWYVYNNLDLLSDNDGNIFSVQRNYNCICVDQSNSISLYF
jgi:hypothetical protein